jgi:mannose-6-phosphate isomerase-like protein (cupin superfamily)
MCVSRMSEVWYYKGVHKVKVVTESEGYWIVEALEEFDDDVDGEKVTVKVGEQRIVPVETVHKTRYLAPPVKEHAYELEMEKKLKRLIAEEENKQSGK